MNHPFPNRRPITAWKIAVVMVCLCVFLLGLNAKLALYSTPSPGVTGVAAAKLWTGKQKMELAASLDYALVALFAVFLFLTVQRPRREQLPAETDSPPSQVSTLGLHRFLRPPPSILS